MGNSRPTEGGAPIDVGALFANALADVFSDFENAPSAPKAERRGKRKRSFQDVDGRRLESTRKQPKTKADASGVKPAPKSAPSFDTVVDLGDDTLVSEHVHGDTQIDLTDATPGGTCRNLSSAPNTPKGASGASLFIHSDEDAEDLGAVSAPEISDDRPTTPWLPPEWPVRSDSAPVKGRDLPSRIIVERKRVPKLNLRTSVEASLPPLQWDTTDAELISQQPFVLDDGALGDRQSVSYFRSPLRTPHRPKKGLIVPHTNEDIVLDQGESSSPSILRFGNRVEPDLLYPQVTEKGSPIATISYPESMGLGTDLAAAMYGAYSDAFDQHDRTRSASVANDRATAEHFDPGTLDLSQFLAIKKILGKSSASTTAKKRKIRHKLWPAPISAHVDDPEKTLVEDNNPSRHVEPFSSPLIYPLSSPSRSSRETSSSSHPATISTPSIRAPSVQELRARHQIRQTVDLESVARSMISRMQQHQIAVYEIEGKFRKEEVSLSNRLGGAPLVHRGPDTTHSRARMQTLTAQFKLKLRAALEFVAKVEAEFEADDLDS